MLKKLLSSLKLESFKFLQLRKGYLIALVILIVTLGIIFWGFKTVNKPPIIPEEVLNQGLKSTLEAKTLRFKMEYKTKSDSKEDYWSKIEGEKADKDKILIKGEILKTPVEIYQMGNKTYIKNSIGTWTVLDENDIHQQELLVNEINPLAIFYFKDIPIVEYKKTEELRGEECYLIEYKPNIANQYLEVLATDFIYKSWINAESKVIEKTRVEANSKAKDKGKLIINLDFYDYGEEIKINPPEVKE